MDLIFEKINYLHLSKILKSILVVEVMGSQMFSSMWDTLSIHVHLDPLCP